MLKFSESAQTALKEILKEKSSNDTGIRLKLDETGGLEVDKVALDQLEPQEEPLRDPITHFFVEYEGYMVIVDKAGQDKLGNAQINYQGGGVLSGQWSLEIPDPIPDAVYKGPNMEDPTVQKVAELLDKEINPGLAMHGGKAELLNVLENKVYLRFGGGCQGCSMIDATVKQGIETRLKEAVPGIVGVIDETDHSAGDNPFFQ